MPEWPSPASRRSSTNPNLSKLYTGSQRRSHGTTFGSLNHPYKPLYSPLNGSWFSEVFRIRRAPLTSRRRPGWKRVRSSSRAAMAPEAKRRNLSAENHLFRTFILRDFCFFGEYGPFLRLVVQWHVYGFRFHLMVHLQLLPGCPMDHPSNSSMLPLSDVART